MKVIYLTQNQFTWVDDWNFDWLNRWKWHAHLDSKGKLWYVRRREIILGERIYISMHREVLKLPYGSKLQVDHIDGNGLNNLEANLRFATNAENHWNQGKGKTNTTGFNGVSFNTQREKYRAQIGFQKRIIHIGWFDDPVDAAFARDRAAVKYYGEFARLNFPDLKDLYLRQLT